MGNSSSVNLNDTDHLQYINLNMTATPYSSTYLDYTEICNSNVNAVIQKKLQ
jgi:hypothetical protein